MFAVGLQFFVKQKLCKKRNESKEAVLKVFLNQIDQNDFASVFDGRMKYGNSNKNQSMYRILNYLGQLSSTFRLKLIKNKIERDSEL